MTVTQSKRKESRKPSTPKESVSVVRPPFIRSVKDPTETPPSVRGVDTVGYSGTLNGESHETLTFEERKVSRPVSRGKW